MSITSDLISFLNDGTGVEVFSLYVPDGVEYPFAVVRMVSDYTDYSQDGKGRRETIFQIDTFDESISGAYDASEVLREKLSGYKGTFGTGSVGAIFIREMQDMWMKDARHYKILFQCEVKW